MNQVKHIKESPPCVNFADRKGAPQSGRGSVWAALALLFFGLSCRWRDGVMLLEAIVFAGGAAWFFIGRDKVLFHAGRYCMSISASFLHLAAAISVTRPKTTFSIATLHGHGAGTDPNDAPVTISQLIDILDKSPQAKATLDIPNYRITAERITPFEDFVVKYAGRDGGPISQEQPAWFDYDKL